MAITQSGLERNQGLQAVKSGHGFVFVFWLRNQMWLRISKCRVGGDWEVGKWKIKKGWSILDIILCSVEDN